MIIAKERLIILFFILFPRVNNVNTTYLQESISFSQIIGS